VSRYTQLWLYLHLTMVMAIAAGGAGVLNTVAHAATALPDDVRWLLVGALAVALLSIALITLVLEARTRKPEMFRRVEIAIVASAALTMAVGISGWGAKASLGAMVILLLLPVGTGLMVWYRAADPTAGLG
jgi:hypothetical protein